MRSLFSNLFFLALVAGIWFGVRQYINPYDYRAFAPGWPMTVPLGSQAYYFPVSMIEPRYPGGVYGYGVEPVVWMNLDPKTYKILPQPEGAAVKTDGRIDAALSSDANPSTKKVTESYRAMAAANGFKPFKHELARRKDGDETHYLGKETLISCAKDKCLLFCAFDPEVRLFIDFNKAHLPAWKTLVKNMLAALKAARRKPGVTVYGHSIMPAPVGKFFKGAVQQVAKDTRGG